MTWRSAASFATHMCRKGSRTNLALIACTLIAHLVGGRRRLGKYRSERGRETAGSCPPLCRPIAIWADCLAWSLVGCLNLISLLSVMSSLAPAIVSFCGYGFADRCVYRWRRSSSRTSSISFPSHHQDPDRRSETDFARIVLPTPRPKMSDVFVFGTVMIPYPGPVHCTRKTFCDTLSSTSIILSRDCERQIID